MFGPRLGTVFASRWKALWWAASILALAYCSVPSPEDSQQTAADQAAQQEAVKQLQTILEQQDAPRGN